MVKNTLNENINTENTLVKIKVIGVGGAGNNAIIDFHEKGITGIGFISANTDEQDLTKNVVYKSIKLGKFNNRGLGAGANPNIGKKTALESEKEIKKCLQDTDLLIIVAGMGGGTGTGAAPIISGFAKEMGILTLGIVTTPFITEGELREKNAEMGLRELRKNIDSLITISNEKLSMHHGRKSLKDAFDIANNIMYQNVKMISDLINKISMINIDFADVKKIIKNQGTAISGTARIHDGEDKAMRAAIKAVANPILESSIENAKSALVSISGSSSLTLDEVNEAVKSIQYLAGNNTDIIFGVNIDDDLEDDVMVSVIATGIQKIEETKTYFSDRWAKKIIKKVKKN